MKLLQSLGCLCLGIGIVSPFSGEANAQSWESRLEGVDFTTHNGLRAVRIDLDLVGVSIFPQVSAQGEPMAPNRWAEKHGLQVAINANFFSMATMQNPCSHAICNGVDWGSGNPSTYAQIGFTKDNRLKYHEQWHTDPPAWGYNVVSGSPEIVKNGAVISVASTQACYDLGHCSQAAARSGIGVDKAGKYLYLAITTSGCTVESFASKMISLGCDYAINLDGGGSSGLYINGQGFGNVSGRTDAVNLGFKVNPKPAYICKIAEIDNPGSVFFDMSADHWALSAASALKEHNVTQGCGGEPGRPLFCPSCGMRRYEAAEWIAAGLGLANAAPESPSYADVPASAPGYGAIEAILGKGIISPAEKFRPNDLITRAEAAIILANAFLGDTSPYQNAPTPTFSDMPASHWAYAAVEALARNCKISGSDGKFIPDQTMDKATFASMFARAAGYIEGACVFDKKCTTIGENTCHDAQISTCVAYEPVISDCNAGLSCFHGACAQCDIEVQPVCENQTAVQCVDGAWVKQDCEPSGQVCDNGACVQKRECDDSYTDQCSDQTHIKRCDDGKFVEIACADAQICQNGSCINQTNINPGDDNPSENTPSENDKPEHGNADGSTGGDDGVNVSLSSESSCAMNRHSTTPSFWLFASLFGMLGLRLRRRRS